MPGGKSRSEVGNFIECYSSTRLLLLRTLFCRLLLTKFLTVLGVFAFVFGSGNALTQELPPWQSFPFRENLYELRQQEIDQGANFDELNKNLVESINIYSPQANSRRSMGVTHEQAQKLLNELKSEDFFINAREHYDDKLNLGLCFGRSIYLHLMLLKFGVNKDSNKWWALDTNFDAPMLIEDWVYEMKRRSQDKTYRLFRSTLIDKSRSLRFYITDAQKIGPSGWEYNIRAGGLFDGFYNNYFRVMFKVLKNKVIPVGEKFNSTYAGQCRRLFL